MHCSAAVVVRPSSLAAAASRQRWALATSLCALLCLSLLVSVVLLLLGSTRPLLRPLFAVPRQQAPEVVEEAPWERYVKLAQAAPGSPTPGGVRDRDAEAVVVAPPATPDLDEEEEEEGGSDAISAAPAPAPSPSPAEEEGEEESCELFEGRWVHDPARQPLYEAAECPFLSAQVTCRRNGRPDSGYEQWRWQPRGHCGGADGHFGSGGREAALEQCRNRRVVFVGDSLNRNMWESLACLLYTAVPDRSRTRVDDVASGYTIFRAMDYNCTVEFFWSPFLVTLETKHDRTRALKLDQLPATLQQLRGADVLVFNTGHWWTHTGKLRAWDHLERDGKQVEMGGEEAFNRALRTWARWVDQSVDTARTRVFFRSVSPEHKSENWCYNQTSPVADGTTVVPWFPKSLVSIVERNIRSMRTTVAYLNITRLSELRIDAHPSVYTITREGRPLSVQQRQQPLVYADCSHWCLPGLPDTWNLLLLASLARSPINVH
ncbi:protein trichome birefringence-like 3 [Oryza brachyantha]|uniref:Uncharacterized protein n=1 Tax=Oryza brachyantha TaxID=4533 RepID=J3L1V5_ORYBR|nr:protein trichome birefringence-like 3 [Oryza brachyantha]